MHKLILIAAKLAVLLSVPAQAQQQTYGPGPGGWIPNPSSTEELPGVFTSIISIGDSAPIISLDAVTLVFGPRHSYVGDLEVILTAPDGEDVHLFSRVRGSGPSGFGDSSDLFGNYRFVNSGGDDFDAAAVATMNSEDIANGTYDRSTTPEGTPLAPQDFDTFEAFAGDNIQGNWILTIHDWDTDSSGGLESWSLTITVPSPGCAVLLGVGLSICGVTRRRS